MFNVVLFGKLSVRAVLSFFGSALLCSLMIIITIVNRSNFEKITMEQLIQEKSVQTNDVISKLLFKTQTLATLVIQNDGTVDDFERVAAGIVDDPVIKNVLLAPGGKVSDVYPKEGNEAVIGLDFFEEGDGNREAVLAKETGELVFGGPFVSLQGGEVLVGRLPVYLDSQDGEKEFWGLVSVTLNYPDALEGADLITLETQGFYYEIWRINPDNNEKQIIANSNESKMTASRYIEKHIPILNADWFFRIAPIRHWYEYPESWLMILSGLCISFLIAFTTQNNSTLKRMKNDLARAARIDSLTDIYNRRYFMEIASAQIDKAKRLKKECYVIIFDLDHFKKVNDKYGHLAGDEVLKNVAAGVKGVLRSYDLFARYGGEEFILFIDDTDRETVAHIAERIRTRIEETIYKFKDEEITISASLGVALVNLTDDFENIINCADIALYEAKKRGRNKVVFYGDMVNIS